MSHKQGTTADDLNPALPIIRNICHIIPHILGPLKVMQDLYHQQYFEAYG